MFMMLWKIEEIYWYVQRMAHCAVQGYYETTFQPNYSQSFVENGWKVFQLCFAENKNMCAYIGTSRCN